MSFTANSTGGKYYITQARVQSPYIASGDEVEGYGLISQGAFINRVAVAKEISEIQSMDIRNPYYTVYRWRRTA